MYEGRTTWWHKFLSWTWYRGLSADWICDCLYWRGDVLTGEHGHWCHDYDGLPMDETCLLEWPCACRRAELAAEDLQKDTTHAPHRND